MKKLFTLIELIIVLVVIGVLATIVIPNINSFKKEANLTAIQGNTNNLQTAVDTYALKNFGELPIDEVTPYNPRAVNLSKLHPDYIRNLPNVEVARYWIDFSGKVWGSTVDSPDVSYGSGEISWQPREGEVPTSYNVYEVSNETNGEHLLSTVRETKRSLKFILNTKKTKATTSDGIKVGKAYVVSAIDESGFESAPVGGNYEGFKTLEEGISETPETPTPTPTVDPNLIYKEMFDSVAFRGTKTTADWLSGSLPFERRIWEVDSDLSVQGDASNESDRWEDVIIDGDGNYVVTGYNNNGSMPYTPSYIAKYDTNLNLIDKKRAFEGSSNSKLYSIALLSNGDYIIAGAKNSVQMEFVKFDKNLNRITEKTIQVSGHSYIYDVAEDGQGNIIAVGMTSSDLSTLGGNTAKGDFDFVILKLDNNLNVLKVNNFGSSNYDKFESVIVNKDGHYIAAGSSSGDMTSIGGVNSTNHDIVLVKFDKDLNRLALTTHVGGGIDQISEVIQLEEGGYVATGSSTSDWTSKGGSTYFTGATLYKMDANFNLLQVNNHIPSITAVYSSLTQNSHGEIVSVGHRIMGNYTDKYLISKHDTNLNLLHVLYEDPPNGQYINSRFHAVVENKDGQLIAVGHSRRHYAIYKFENDFAYNADTSQLWSTEINLMEPKTTIKVKVDATIPNGTNYSFFISTNNKNYYGVPHNSLDGVQDISLPTQSEKVYWRIQFNASNRTVFEAPKINSVEIYK